MAKEILKNKEFYRKLHTVLVQLWISRKNCMKTRLSIGHGVYASYLHERVIVKMLDITFIFRKRLCYVNVEEKAKNPQDSCGKGRL